MVVLSLPVRGADRGVGWCVRRRRGALGSRRVVGGGGPV